MVDARLFGSLAYLSRDVVFSDLFPESNISVPLFTLSVFAEPSIGHIRPLKNIHVSVTTDL